MSRSAEYFCSQHDKLQVAREIAERAGVLVRCPKHNTVVRGPADVQKAIDAGLALFNEKQLITDFETREDVIKAIHDAVNVTSHACPVCAGARRDEVVQLAK